MPRVKTNKPIKFAESDTGVVEVIKHNIHGHKGCAVRFPGHSYDTWFHDSEDTDRRSNYMRDLELID